MTTVTTRHSRPADAPSKVHPDVLYRQWIAALQEPAPRVRTPILYRVMQLLVVIVMMVLPLIYLGLIGLLGYVVYLHTVNDAGMITAVRSPRGMLFMFIVYLAPIVGGVVSMFFMIKPFFAPRIEEHIPVTISADQQPKLFVLVENLCHAIKAPVPKQIVVDTQINASASFRKGFLSFLGHDLTLTIGLPLVSCMSLQQFVGVLAHEFGHFSQGAGMRLSYIISSISHWFARVVYERDQWDQALVDLSTESESAMGSIFIAFVRLMVWLSRCVLWILMMVGNIASSLLLRQMEYDADRHEALVAGSDAFEKTVIELRRIYVGMDQARNHIRQFMGENQVPDNIPSLIAYHSNQVGASQLARIALEVSQSRAGLFSTHPSDKRRIAAAKRQQRPGMFPFTQPASMLFSDYDKLCRGVTMHTLHHQFGEIYNRLQLVDVSKLQQEHQKIQQAQSYCQQFLGPCLTPLMPIRFAGHISDKLANPRQAMAELKQLCEQTRMMSADPGMAQSQEQQTYAFTKRIDLKQFVIRKEHGLNDSPAVVEMASDSNEAIQIRTRKLDQLIRDAAIHLQPLNTMQAKRLLLALQLLHNPAVDKLKDVNKLRESSKKQFLAYHALIQIYDRVLQVNELQFECLALLQSIDKRKQDEAFINHILAQSKELAIHARAIRNGLQDFVDPYPVHDQTQRLGTAIVPQLTDPKDVAATIDMAGTLVERTFATLKRLLSDLVSHAQTIEKAAGIGKMDAVNVSTQP